MITAPTLHVGSPTEAGPLTVFPVWTDAPVPARRIRTVPPKGARIREQADGSTVEALTLDNPGRKPFVLLEGTILVGGWQQRVLVHDVLVGAETTLELDVRCVEQGRWSGAGDHDTHRLSAPLAVRGALRGLRRDRPQRPASPDVGPRFEADQGDVWRRVARYERGMGVASATSSLVEVADRTGERLDEVLARVRPLPGQRGVLIGIGGHPALLEVFDDPRSLAERWAGLLGGVLLDAQLVAPAPTPGHRARSFARRVSGCPLAPTSRGGAGVVRANPDGGLASVAALTDGDDALLHLGALNARHDLVVAA